MTLDRDKLVKILGLLGSDKSGEILSAAQAAVALIRNANTSWAELLNQSAVADDGRTFIAELRLRAENGMLREMVMQLSAENHALREQAAGGLAYRILDGVRQSGQALRALAIAFDGSLSRAQHVVVHGLVAAGIALALGIVVLLALHDAAMLRRPTVGSGTIASSEQETPEATARSGELPAEAAPARKHFRPTIQRREGDTRADIKADTVGRRACPGRRFDNPPSDSAPCYCCSGPDRSSARRTTSRHFFCSGRGTSGLASDVSHAQPALVRRRNGSARDSRR